MNSGSLRDRTDRGERINVDNLNLGAVRNVKPARRGVDIEVVPAAAPGNWNLLDDGIAAIGSEQRAAEQDHGNSTQSAISHLFSSRESLVHMPEFCLKQHPRHQNFTRTMN